MDLGDFFRFIFKLGGGRDTLKRDVQLLKTLNQTIKEKLIPFSVSEAQLISYNLSHITGKTNRKNGQSGIIDTIYYEHLLVFTTKIFNRNYTLTVVESTEDTFIFVVKDTTIHVIMNDVEAGYIIQNGVFYNKAKQPIAYWDWNASSPTQNIEILGNKLGVINNYKSQDVTTPRLFNFFSEPTQDEWSIMLCLVLGRLIVRES